MTFNLLLIHYKVILYCFGLPATRFRLLKHTRLNVVAFLNELPKTQHDIASFNVDVNTYTVSELHRSTDSLTSLSSSLTCFSTFFPQSTLLSFTVSGVFKEGMNSLHNLEIHLKMLKYYRQFCYNLILFCHVSSSGWQLP